MVMPNPRQIRAAKFILESTSIADGLVKAGYSKKTARAPSQVTRSKGFLEAAKPIVAQLEKLRNQAIRRAMATGDKASYDSAMRGVDLTTKNIQLLGGKPTEIKGNNYDNLTDDELIARLAVIRGTKN
jgi:hypothetical protein